MKVNTPDGEMICRCMLLQCTSDLQARAPIANMKGLMASTRALHAMIRGTIQEEQVQ